MYVRCEQRSFVALVSSLHRSFEDFDPESVFNQPNPEVAPCRNQVVVEIKAALMDKGCLHSRLLRTKTEKAAWLLLKEVRKVFAAWEWYSCIGHVLRSEPLRAQSPDMLGLSGGVDCGRV